MNDPMNFEAINLEMQVGKNERKKNTSSKSSAESDP